MKRFLFRLLLSAAKAVPGAASVMDAKQQEIINDMKEDFIGHTFDAFPVNNALPERGMTVTEVSDTLVKFSELEGPKYKTGKVSGGIYHGGEELSALITKAYGM